MTPDERFERIEQNLLTLTQLQIRTQEAIIEMSQSIGRYVEAADARMKRIEENLDALIRAITAEHSNGKGRQ